MGFHPLVPRGFKPIALEDILKLYKLDSGTQSLLRAGVPYLPKRVSIPSFLRDLNPLHRKMFKNYSKRIKLDNGTQSLLRDGVPESLKRVSIPSFLGDLNPPHRKMFKNYSKRIKLDNGTQSLNRLKGFPSPRSSGI
jgi:hypothetical protein